MRFIKRKICPRKVYVQRGTVLIVMLGGGDKSTQSADIAKAVKLAARFEG